MRRDYSGSLFRENDGASSLHSALGEAESDRYTCGHELTGNLILTVMLAFAEYERGMIVERTQTGKSVARLNPDFHDGRPRKYTDAQIQLGLELLTAGKSYGQVQKMTGISKSTLIRARQQRLLNKIPTMSSS